MRPTIPQIAKWLATGAVFRIAVTVSALGVGAVCGALANLLMPATFATLHGHTGLTAIQLGALGFWAASIFREVPSLGYEQDSCRNAP